MREEIGSAKDQTGISARRFEKWITLKFFLILKIDLTSPGLELVIRDHQGDQSLSCLTPQMTADLM